MFTRISRRALFCGASIAAVAGLTTRGYAAFSSNSKIMQWRVLRVGGGGWLTGMDISPDGSVRLVRADTYGGYRWDQADQQWTQLVTAESMPASDIGVDRGAGIYELRVAPGQPTRLYMCYGGCVYRSDSSGSRWKRTKFAKATMNANDAFRTFGPKMAVDPANPDIVYVGTAQNGLFATLDGGRTWRAIADVPLSESAAEGEYPSIAGIAFDPDPDLIAGKTKRVYVASYGHGVYSTTDAGRSWRLLEGGPRKVSHGKIAKDGFYYAVDDEGSSVWRWDKSGWMEITPGLGTTASPKGTWATIVTDPFDVARVIAVKGGGSLSVSLDRGGSWRDGGGPRRSAPDVPWLAWTQESYMSVGELLLDPVKPDQLWFAEGIGVWHAIVPSGTEPVTFISQTAGIEQLVANQILVPPGGKPNLASWDRPVFYIDNPDRYPTTHGPDNQRAIVMGWALDYASTNPVFLAGIFNWWGVEKSGFSADGGRTWVPFASYPLAIADGKIGGCVAVSTPSNMIWVPSNNANPYYTTDGGNSWAPIVLPGVPRDGETGWGFAYYLNRHIVAADRVIEGTFYLYNYRSGLYRSADGGATWVLAYSGEIAPFSGVNAKLRSVPDHAGHLFFTSGAQGGADDPHPAANSFMRSIDGGTTWIAVPDVLEVRGFGFGKGRGYYPAIFVVGWVTGRYGIWRSGDNAESWIKIGDFPLGILDNVNTIEGDGAIVDRVYVGFGGAGYAYASE